MKKTFKIILAMLLVAATTFTACNETLESGSPQLKDGEVTLTFLTPDDDSGTKITISNMNYLNRWKVSWQEGDKVYAYQTDENHTELSDEVEFTCTNALSGIFTGNIAGKQNLDGDALQASDLNLASTKKIKKSNDGLMVDLSTFASTDLSKACLMIGERSGSSDFQMELKGNIIKVMSDNTYDYEAAFKIRTGTAASYSYVWTRPSCAYADGAWATSYIPSDTFAKAKFTVAKGKGNLSNLTPTYVLTFQTAENENDNDPATIGIAIESDGLADDYSLIVPMKPLAYGTERMIWEVEFYNVVMGTFPVGPHKYAYFTRGNLFWNGNTWKYERTQFGYPTSRSANHIGHFYWTKTAAAAYANSYDDGECTVSDHFFADGSDAAHTITLDNQSGLRALTKDEWYYLLNTRDNASDLHKTGVTITTATDTIHNCLVVAPYDWSLDFYPLQDEYNLTSNPMKSTSYYLASSLLVLPPAGYWEGTDLTDNDTAGSYWLSTAEDTYATHAYRYTFDDNGFSIGTISRSSCYPIRLAKVVGQ